MDGNNTKPIEERFAAALEELMMICGAANMHPDAMAEIMEREAKWCRDCYATEGDNNPEKR